MSDASRRPPNPPRPRALRHGFLALSHGPGQCFAEGAGSAVPDCVSAQTRNSVRGTDSPPWRLDGIGATNVWVFGSHGWWWKWRMDPHTGDDGDLDSRCRRGALVRDGQPAAARNRWPGTAPTLSL